MIRLYTQRFHMILFPKAKVFYYVNFESGFTFCTFKLFLRKNYFEFLLNYHPVGNIKEIKTDELGINGPN